MTIHSLPLQSFCLIRHGETTANAAGIVAGRSDVPLTERGRQQARALSDRTWPDRITLFSSPMSRARETCELAFPGRDYTVVDGIRERDWGVFEGRPLREQPDREVTPDDGESWSAMLSRVHRTIVDACAASDDALPVLVCHAGVIRTARVLWTSGSAGTRPPNAAPILFRISGHHVEERAL